MEMNVGCCPPLGNIIKRMNAGDYTWLQYSHDLFGSYLLGCGPKQDQIWVAHYDALAAAGHALTIDEGGARQRIRGQPTSAPQAAWAAKLARLMPKFTGTKPGFMRPYS